MDGVIDAHSREPLPISNELIGESAEITIHFESSGSFDSGCAYLTNGDPGYPPEGYDERLFVSATIREHGSKEDVWLPDDIGRKLFDMYEQQIKETELDYTQENDYE